MLLFKRNMRPGKHLKEAPGPDLKWDGTLAEKNLPADDYW